MIWFEMRGGVYGIEIEEWKVKIMSTGSREHCCGL